MAHVGFPSSRSPTFISRASVCDGCSLLSRRSPRKTITWFISWDSRGVVGELFSFSIFTQSRSCHVAASLLPALTAPHGGSSLAKGGESARRCCQLEKCGRGLVTGARGVGFFGIKARKIKRACLYRREGGEREGGFIVFRTANVTSPVIGNVAMD